MIGEVLKNFEIYLHQLTPMLLLDLASSYGLSEAKEWMLMLKLFAECTSYTTSRKLEQMAFTRTLAVIILHIRRMRRPRLLAIAPSGQPSKLMNGFT
jgi:hypothetical protein